MKRANSGYGMTQVERTQKIKPAQVPQPLKSRFSFFFAGTRHWSRNKLVQEPRKCRTQFLVQFLVHGFEMILHLPRHTVLTHRQRQVRSPLEDGQMCYLFPFDMEEPLSFYGLGCGVPVVRFLESPERHSRRYR